ncbi:MAG: efflux RND transporter permease subunit [Burkholderiaceae bacterium]
MFATMVMVALLVLGLFSFQRLQIDQFPNIDFPVVVVTTEYPGASPEIVESEVTKKVEEAVNAIAGVNTPVRAVMKAVGRHHRRFPAPRRRSQQSRRRCA